MASLASNSTRGTTIITSSKEPH